MKIVFISGDHLRHKYVADSLTNINAKISWIIEKREDKLPKIPKNLSNNLKRLFRDHFQKRLSAEKSYFKNAGKISNKKMETIIKIKKSDLNKKIEVMDIEVNDYSEVIPENNSVDDQELIHEIEDDILFEQTIEIESKLNSSDFQVETQTIEATIKNDKENQSQDPINNSISDFQKQRSKERRLRMKEFNYKFNKSKIDDIENEPAYKRKGIELEDKNYSSENNISRTSVGLDENDDMKIRKNNSFLHDNVD